MVIECSKMSNKKKIKKIISLGSSCQPALGLKDLFVNQKRFPFDYSIVNHETLCFLLQTNFDKIINRNDQEGMDSVFRVNFYTDLEGFFFGHQKLKDIKDIYDKIKRRCYRFLNLDKEQSFLFVRHRDVNWYDDKWSENIYLDTLMDKILDEYDEINRILIEIGFKNFEFLYIISSPIQTLDGSIAIQEGEISHNIYVMDYLGHPSKDNWGKIRDILEERFDFSGLNPN